MLQSLGTNDINNLLTAGNMEQDQDQSLRDWQYQEWMNRQNYPLDNLAIRQGAITNTPSHAGESRTSMLTRNRGTGFVGGAQAGYGMAGGDSNPYAGWGALLGGLLGAYG
jgi:hypothetical protein